MTVIDDILIKILAIDNASKPIAQVNKQLKVMGGTGTNNLKSMTDAVDKARMQYGGFGSSVDKFNAKIPVSSARLKTFDKVVKNTTQSIGKMGNKLGKMSTRLLSAGLAMLFTGMALQKAFGGFLRAAINSYQIAGAETTLFNQKTLELTASWEFFKFSLIDALSQTAIFSSVIDFLIGLVGWFSDLSPRMQAFIGALAVIGFVGGTAMMILGMGLLFVNGMATGFGVSLGVIFLWIALILVVAIALAYVWTSDWNKAIKIIITIIIVLIAVATVLWKLGIISGGVFAVFIIAMLAIIALLVIFQDSFISGLKLIGIWFEKTWVDAQASFLKRMIPIMEIINKISKFFGKGHVFDISIAKMGLLDLKVRSANLAKEGADLAALQKTQNKEEFDAFLAKFNKSKEDFEEEKALIEEQLNVDKEGLTESKNQTELLSDIKGGFDDLKGFMPSTSQ